MKTKTKMKMKTKTKTKRILSIDPSTKALGWALFTHTDLESSGCMKSQEKDWIRNVDAMVALIHTILPSVDVVIIEQPDVYMSSRGQAASNSGAIMKLMGCVFAIRQLCIDAGLEVYLLPVRQWKGNLPKEITAKRVKRRWGVTTKSDDESDAIGIGTYYLQHILKYDLTVRSSK